MKKFLLFLLVFAANIYSYAQSCNCANSLSTNSNNFTFPSGATCVSGNVTLEDTVTFDTDAVICVSAGQTLNFNNVNNFNFPTTGEVIIEVYGDLNINGNPTFGKNIHINIHPGGNLITGNLKFEGDSSSITNNGSVSFSNLELGNGKTITIDNYATMQVQGNMNFASGTSFVRNQANLNVTSSFSVSATSVYTNCGAFEGQFNLGGGKVINTGHFISSQIDMGGNSNARFDNYNHVQLTGNLNMGGTNSIFYNQGIVDASTGNGIIQSDGNLIGPETGKGFFLLRSQTVINNGNIGPNLGFTRSDLGSATIWSDVFNSSLVVQSSVTFGDAMPPLTSLPSVMCPNLDGSFPQVPLSLACNEFTAIAAPAFPLEIVQANTGTLGFGVVSQAQNVIDGDFTSYASLSPVLLSSAFLSVKDKTNIYPAETFVGFRITNQKVLSLDLVGNTSIVTYLNGVQQESVSGNALLLDVGLLNFNSPKTIGFITTLPFNEVQIKQKATVNLGTTKVYSVVMKKFCEGNPLPCNTYIDYTTPAYPVAINSAETGIKGLLAVGASVNSTDAVLDNNLSNFATITLVEGVGTSGVLAVKKPLSNFEAGTFAGFEIENTNLLDLNLLDNIQLSTYKDGVFQESVSGSGLIVGLNTDLLGSSGKNTIGISSTLEFDEVRLSINSLLAVNLGTTKIYKFIVFKGCAPVLECNNTYTLKNPEFPVVINYNRTGVQGIACVQCKVEDAQNLIDSDPTNKARLYTTVGAVGSVDISVLNPISLYPKGSFAGFTISQDVVLLNLNLLDFIVVTTYLDGVLQESKTGADLLDLSLLFTASTGEKNLGFYTTKDFDEIKFSVLPIVGVINLVNVHKAFIDTSTSEGFNCIKAVKDDFTISAGGSSTISILDNDLINITQASPSNVIITEISSTNSGLSIDTSTGIINVAPGTPSGTYTMVYRICDIADSGKCSLTIVTVNVQGACYKPASLGGTSLPVNHGITALSRAGAETGNWPMERKGAWTVLESKSKGFVVNRIPTTLALSNITNPIEGMMVYDEEATCLKIYTIKEGELSAGWYCLTKQTCPD